MKSTTGKKSDKRMGTGKRIPRMAPLSFLKPLTEWGGRYKQLQKSCKTFWLRANRTTKGKKAVTGLLKKRGSV